MRDLLLVELLEDEKFEELFFKLFKVFVLFFLVKKVDIFKYCKYYFIGGSCGKKGKCCFCYDLEV